MIFKSVTNIKSRKEISFFIEKISLYTKINKLIAEKNTISIENKAFKEISKSTINELIHIGLISNLNEISVLEKTIDKPLFQELISSVNFYLQNRELVGTSLDKLNNNKRLKLQKKYLNSKSPKIVDFFCGAGGLSLGFFQAGFNIELANDHEDVCIETFKYNHPELPENKIIQGDIKKIVDHIDNYIKTISMLWLVVLLVKDLVRQISKGLLMIPEMSFINIL